MPLHDHHNDSIVEVGESCYLYLQEPNRRIVAEAQLYKLATMCHNMKIQESELKVSVTVVREGEEDAYLPLPNDEVQKLGNAKGCFILWPRELVSLTMTPPSVKKSFELS